MLKITVPFLVEYVTSVSFWVVLENILGLITYVKYQLRTFYVKVDSYAFRSVLQKFEIEIYKNIRDEV